jgi:hypothetical protein
LPEHRRYKFLELAHRLHTDVTTMTDDELTLLSAMLTPLDPGEHGYSNPRALRR